MNDQKYSPFDTIQQPEEGSAGSENVPVRYCGICGTPIQEGERFCKQCGTAVFSGMVEEKPEKTKKETKKWIPIFGAIAGGVVVCVIVLGLIFSLAKKNKTTGVPAAAQAPIQDDVEYGQDYYDPEQDYAVPELDFADNTSQEPDADLAQAPYNQQIVWISKGTNGYELVLDRWLDTGEWETAFTCKAIISDYGITSRKTEGDGQTPAGSFNILFCIGKSKPSTDLDYINITSGDVWVDDSNSRYYNTLQRNNSSSKDWRSAEDIYSYFQSGTYNAAIFFDYNGDGISPGSAVSGNGSVIFLLGRNDFSGAHSNSGDIYISSADMTVLLTLLDSSKNPIIVIE